DLWSRAFSEMAAAYPDVSTDYVHVDAACVYLVEDPSRFDVVVTDNIFGDILTDLGAVIQGGMGVAAGANLNPEGVSMFEPIGGTAPDHAGKGTINPLAAIAAMQMLLVSLGEVKAADRVDAGIGHATQRMKSMRAGEMGYATSEVGDLVVEGATSGATRGGPSSSTTPRSATAPSAPISATRSTSACASCTSSTRSASPSWKDAGPAPTRAPP